MLLQSDRQHAGLLRTERLPAAGYIRLVRLSSSCPQVHLGVLVALLLICLSCTFNRDILSLDLADGSNVSTLAGVNDTVAVLMYDPADCFTCSTPVHGWLSWQSASAHRTVVLVLTRRPTPLERKLLVAARLRVGPTLRHTGSRHPWPAIALFAHGRTLAIVRGRTAVRSLADNYLHDPIAIVAPGAGPQSDRTHPQ